MTNGSCRLELPATLPRTGWRFAAVARDAPVGHFHLRHRRRAAGAWKTWRAAGEELLRAERGDDHELERVQMNGTERHRPIDWGEHGFLGKAMVRNPLHYGRLKTAERTLARGDRPDGRVRWPSQCAARRAAAS